MMKFQRDDLLQMLEVYRENFNVVRSKEVDYIIKIRLQFQFFQAEFYRYFPDTSDANITLVVGFLYGVERTLW